MGDLRGKLKQAFNPQKGEVYRVADESIKMAGKKEDKYSRPIVVMSSNINDSFDIIPISSQGTTTNVRFPVKPCMTDLNEECKIIRRSFAVLKEYQTLKKNDIFEFCGEMERNCFRAIERSHKVYVLGKADDVDIDI